MRGGVAAVALACVLAGCSIAVPTAPSGASPADTSPGGTAPLDGSPTGATPTPGWAGDPDNHFRERVLTVAVDATATDAARDHRALVREALDYWETNADRYAGFPIEYELAGNASGAGGANESADLVVAFVPVVDDCGTEGHAAGCAPVLTDRRQVDRPVRVRVRTGLSNRSTVRVLKHEFGHTLGLAHGDEPAEVMAPSATLTTRPLPNATERALPWASPDLAVYVDYGAVASGSREEAERQVAGALSYFEGGANGTVPGNVTFSRAENRSTADVVVEFVETPPCADRGSCGRLAGTDPDGDGAIETYTRLVITVGTDGLDPETYGWHVGYWLGRGFGLRGEELPVPLRSDDPAVRTSEWWRAG